MSRLALALEQLDAVRKYTLDLLDTLAPADWLRQPREGVSHIAWQVGHLAIAEYRLTLQRLRGRRPEDADLIPDDFAPRYGRLSTPDPDPAKNATPAELRAVLDRVHQQALHELQALPETELDQPPGGKPHPRFRTKLGAILWCGQHEMLHAGQIGLLRRLLGYPPIW